MGIAQMALLAGADDAGSTMMEENVVSASERPNSVRRNTNYNFLFNVQDSSQSDATAIMSYLKHLMLSSST